MPPLDQDLHDLEREQDDGDHVGEGDGDDARLQRPAAPHPRREGRGGAGTVLHFTLLSLEMSNLFNCVSFNFK